MENLLKAIREYLAPIEALLKDLSDHFAKLSLKTESLERRIEFLEKGSGGDPGPIKPPTTPEINIEIDQFPNLPKAGEEIRFEAVISTDPDLIETVIFYNGDNAFQVERNHPYEAKTSVSDPGFNLKIIVTLKSGDKVTLEKFIEVEKAVSVGNPVIEPTEDDYLIIHLDGNNNDDDDIAALPIFALYAAAVGITDKTIIFYNNSRDENDVEWQVQAMRRSANFAESLGIQTFDYAEDEDATFAEMEILLESGAKITSLEGGPMGAIYRALESTDEKYHSNLALVSHSQWNENRDNSGENKKWNALKEKFPAVTYVDIADQNPNFWSDDWDWMDSSAIEVVNQAREAMKGAGEKDAKKVNDASDSGMMFYYIFGKEDGTVLAAKELFERAFAGSASFEKLEDGLYYLDPTPDSEKNWLFASPGSVLFGGDDSFQYQKDETTLLFGGEVEPGEYQVKIWNKGGDAEDVSKENDSWIFANGIFARKGLDGEEITDTNGNDTSNGFIKFYSNTADWTLQTSAIDNDQHQIFIRHSGGELEFYLGGRSFNHAVGRIFLKRIDLEQTVVDQYEPDFAVSDPAPIEPPILPPSEPVSIAEFQAFVDNADGMYYNIDADQEPARKLSENEVEALFDTPHSHIGKPSDRCRIEEVPGLGGRKGFTFLINNQSGGFGDRFSSHKKNGLSKIEYYPKAKGIASYTELFFPSDTFTMRTHFKSSSASSAQVPKDGTNTTNGSVRTSDPGRAELVRFEFYDKKSQGSPNQKGDVMKLYFGEHTNWTSEDFAKIDTPEFFVMGMATYAAHPLTYRWQNMIYPCKPDANGMPTKNRLLMPTDKLIRSWIVWNSNTVIDGVGQYDGSAKWWLQIEGINGGEPFLAAICKNFMWTTGEPLAIESVNVGAYFNPGDQPSKENKFYFLKDEVYYQAFE